MRNIDKELTTKKLQELHAYTNNLKEFFGMDKSIFIDDHHNFGLAEHYLQLSIEIILDISRHLVLALDLKMPDEAHGLFPLLAKKKVLSENFALRNAKMPGFRNRLVHHYSDIDHEKVYEYLKEHLEDFEDFMRQISRYLKNQ